MRRLIVYPMLFAALWPVLGCQHPASNTLCLVDVSQSITTSGRDAEFQAVEGLVDTMRRGDRLVLIPIVGNAMGETSGHVLRMTAPISRQPYDYDLVQFRANARTEIEKLRMEFASRPAMRTDVIGALAIAQDELDLNAEDAQPTFDSRTLYVFSDFIEDDASYRFGPDAELPQKVEAAELARRLQLEHHVEFPASQRVRFVELESNELARLRPERQRWIREFWDAFLAPCRPRWTTVDAVVH